MSTEACQPWIEPAAARTRRTMMPPSESAGPVPVEELPTLRRMDGTTTMSHYVLEKMHRQYSDKSLVLQLQSRLSQQQPREQVHFLLKVLPQAMKDEYEKEGAARGRLEGTTFYVGEIIGRAEPATRIAEDNKNSSARIVASQHEACQALCTVCLHRRHGWETQPGPVRPGLEERRCVNSFCRLWQISRGIRQWLKWHRSLS